MDTKKNIRGSRNAGYERLIAEVEREDKLKLAQKAWENGQPVCVYVRKAIKDLVKDVKLPAKKD